MRHSETIDYGEYRGLLDVAIVGASCRFPGANSMDELWKVLINAENLLRRDAPPERHYMGKWANPRPRSYLSCPIDEFDAAFFNLSGRQAEFMDPQLRIFLEVAWESLEDAGIPPSSLRGTSAGVFAGVSFNEYQQLTRQSVDQRSKMYSMLGTEWSAYTGFLSYFLDVHGPSITSEVACASSGVSIVQAVNSLRTGKCQIAIVGGVHLRLQNEVNVPEAVFGDACKAFDVNANGFTMAEGVGAVVLKLLKDSEGEGDKILGVIKGVDFNNSAATSSFGSPSSERQAKAIRGALKDAEVEGNEISYFLAHGTGTKAGDPAEAEGINRVFGNPTPPRLQPLIISSPKTNFGHTMAASGIHSLIHVLLCLRHSTIPKLVHFTHLNPKINFDSIPAEIASEHRNWPAARNCVPRLAVFNNSGLTGTNVSVVVAEAPPTSMRDFAEDELLPLSIIPISAKSQVSLNAICRSLQENLMQSNTSLQNFAFSLQTTRTHHPIRMCVIAKDKEEAIMKYDTGEFESQGKVSLGTRQRHAPIVFLFTGQGNEYFGMGKNLYLDFACFKNIFEPIAKSFEVILKINLAQLLWHDEKLFLSAGTNLRQPAFFCLQFALSKFWIEILGTGPSAVLGHSLGEICAAVTTGVLSFEDALQVVAWRASFTDSLPPGGMMAIGCSVEALEPLVENFNSIHAPIWVDISAENSPEQCVVSGPTDSLELFKKHVFSQNPTWNSKILKSTRAFHSRDFDQILKDFETYLDGITFSAPTDTKFVSSVTGEITQDLSSSYWAQNLRKPVQFRKGLDTVLKLLVQPKIFIEIGPHPSLLGFVSHVAADGITLCPTLRASDTSSRTLTKSICNLYTTWNGDLQWSVLHIGKKCKRISLPFYPFSRKVYNLATQNSVSTEITGDLMAEDLHFFLGSVQYTSNPFIPTFVNSLSLSYPRFTFISDHVIGGEIILPGACFIDVLLTLQQLYLPKSRIKNVYILKPFQFTGIPIRTKVTLAENNSDLEVSMLVINGKEKDVYFRGTISRRGYNQSSNDIEDLPYLNMSFLATSGHDVKSIFYPECSQCGLEHTGNFQSLEKIWRVGDENCAENYTILQVRIPEGGNHYFLHPIAIDAMVQSLLVDRLTGRYNFAPFLVLPAHFKFFKFYSKPKGVCLYIKVNQASLDIPELYDTQGKLVARLQLTLLTTTKNDFMSSLSSTTILKFYKEKWIVAHNLGDPPGKSLSETGSSRNSLQKQECPSVTLVPENMGPQPVAAERGIAANELTPNLDNVQGLVENEAAETFSAMNSTPVGGQIASRETGLTQKNLTRKPAWLIFTCIETKEIAHSLSKRIHTTIGICPTLVSVGEIFLRTLAHATLNPFDLQHFQSLATEIQQVECVIVLWGMSQEWWNTGPNAQSNFVCGMLNVFKLGSNLTPKNFIFVTRGAVSLDGYFTSQITLITTLAHGMFKTFVTENPSIACTLIDLDPLDNISDSNQIAKSIISLLPVVGSEREILIREKFYVARLTAFSSSFKTPEFQIPPEPFQLLAVGLGKSKSYETRSRQIDPSQTLVKVFHTALNYVDVAVHRQFFEEESAQIGTDFSGVIERLGLGNTRFSVGDRVCGIFKRSVPLSSHVSDSDTQFLVHVPLYLNLREAATIPLGFATALFGMVNLGKLKAGERVLIHTASGGFGLAAIQLAKSVGAQIFATAGSKMKRDYLQNVIKLEHVFDSRSTEFMWAVFKATGREGVDLVVNTITRPGFKEASLALVKNGGRFLELNKLDTWSVEKVKSLRPDVDYYLYDVGDEEKERELELEKILENGYVTADNGASTTKTSKYEPKSVHIDHVIPEGEQDTISVEAKYEDLSPENLENMSAQNCRRFFLRFSGIPHRLSSITQLSTTIQEFSESIHIGKFVLQMVPGKLKLFHAENSYLVTGGLGGIGMEVAAWLLREGAGKVILTARNYPKDQEILDKLKLFGTSVEIILGDIGEEQDAKSLFKALEKLPPLKGIFHAAGVLSDGIYNTLSIRAFEIAFQPKVKGTWNLHNNSLCMNLDYFVLFSSIGVNLGFAGQAPYTAANQFLDTFGKYRQALGLPALVINWGGWAEVGFAKTQLTPEQISHATERTGIIWFKAEQGIRGLERALQLGLDHVTIAKVDETKIGVAVYPKLYAYASDLRNSGSSNRDLGNSGRDDRGWRGSVVGSNKELGGDVLSKLAESVLKSQGSTRMAQLEELIEKIFRIYMSIPPEETLERNQSLALYGMDSLMELEITNKVSKELSVAIPRLQGNKSISGISRLINSCLGEGEASLSIST